MTSSSSALGIARSTRSDGRFGAACTCCIITCIALCPGALVYAGTWTRTFPAQPVRAFTLEHAVQLVKSFGALTLPVFAVALLLLVRSRRYALAALLLVWAALPVAFWFVRPGDSARHHFPSTIPVALGVGIVLARLRTPWRYVALALLAAVNYWAFPPNSSTVTTSGNLIRSGRLTARAVALDQRLARAFAERAEPRAAFLGAYTGAGTPLLS
jgi:hypothetical protein